MMLKYCPACYEDYETEDEKCPKCGCTLEEPMDEETDAEYLELLFNHMRG